MPRKSFEAGMEAGAKPFEEKFQKQADAIEKVGSRIDKRLDDISGIMDVVLDDLSAQERRNVYGLNTIVDISELDDTEKEFLYNAVYAIAKQNTNLTQEQKDYLRSLKTYLKIINVQNEIDLACIENIDNITTQKAIMQTIMEFLFLEYENHNYMDDYEDIFDYFSVNRKGIKEIQAGIDAIYETVGLEGLAEHYGSTKKINIIQTNGLSKADLDLREKAENAYLKYDIKSAFPLFKLLIEQDDGRSCYFLGQIYENGYQGVTKKDTETAKSVRQRGAELGDLLCSLKLAENSTSPEEREKTYQAVFEPVKALAQDGDIYASFELARLYHFNYEAIKDDEQAEYWYNQAAQKGFWGAIHNLGLMNEDNDKDEIAVTYYQRAADIGYESSMANLALYYKFGYCVEENPSKAEALFRSAAESGNGIAQCQLGIGCIESEEYAEARKWLSQAVENDNIAAYYYLAKVDFLDPYGIEDEIIMLSVEPNKSDNYSIMDTIHNPNVYRITGVERMLCNLILGAHYGDKKAQIELAHECRLGLGGWSCLTWLEKSRFFESIDYQINFGIQKFTVELSEEKEFSYALYDGIGRGKEMSKEKDNELRTMAKEVLESFAEDGEPDAQYYLGMEYANKYEYSSKDSDKRLALKWLQECRGNVLAPNLDNTIKCLNKFVVSNWPKCDRFVRDC